MACIGRPKIVINWEEFDKLCGLQCTLREIADWFKCSEDTIKRLCLRERHMTFALYFELKRVSGKIAIRRNLFKMSEHNPYVIIRLAEEYGILKPSKQVIEQTGEMKVKQEVLVIDPGTTEIAFKSLVECGAVKVSAN